LESKLAVSEQYFDSKSVFNKTRPEVSSSGNQVVIEIVVTSVQGLRCLSRFQRSQSEEAAWLILQEEREILTCSQRQIFLGEVLLSKPTFGQPDYMVCFSLVVDYIRIGIVNNYFDLAPHR
jgi:hypothetical protein